MNWTATLIITIVVVVLFMLRRAGRISTQQALGYLKHGALIVDVRSRGEFSSGHLPNAMNFPLEEIEVTLPRRVTDKDQILLLHCQSGMRSHIARVKLKNLGYANTFNLGPYGRAAKIVSSK